jgi:hypothetical protein
MQKDQKHSPKYWVFHRLKDDDVFILTAAKALIHSMIKAEQMYPAAYEKWAEESGEYGFGLMGLELETTEELPE